MKLGVAVAGMKTVVAVVAVAVAVAAVAVDEVVVARMCCLERWSGV